MIIPRQSLQWLIFCIIAHDDYFLFVFCYYLCVLSVLWNVLLFKGVVLLYIGAKPFAYFLAFFPNKEESSLTDNHVVCVCHLNLGIRFHEMWCE